MISALCVDVTSSPPGCALHAPARSRLCVVGAAGDWLIDPPQHLRRALIACPHDDPVGM